MAITLDELTLSDHYVWEDEFDWTPVAQSADRSVTGAYIVQESSLIAGRPISLKDAWENRTTVSELYGLASAVDTSYVLNFNGQIFTVKFVQGGSAISAKMIDANKLSAPENTTLYSVQLKFVTVT